MAERSFAKEVQLLRLGAGQEFWGEGVLAVAKALLQSGVSYITGYQGAPVSHLIGVLNGAHGLLEELGIRFDMSANEAAAAAALAASVNYPLRGAAIFEGPVGTDVAAGALANLASSGVRGGALIIVGEDYGEGSSVTQERSHAFAMKSQIWLLDPRPNLPSIVSAVEKGFELSEASNTPVMLELRIRACHLHGTFETKDNVQAAYTPADALQSPCLDIGRIVLPPAAHLHEKEKIGKRWPAAVRFVEDHKLNEVFEGEATDIGFIVQGGLYNTLIHALQVMGLADAFGETKIPIYVLNVTYPLIESEVLRFCKDKHAVLMLEEGQPEFIEQGMHTILARAGTQVRLEGKTMLPRAGEYTGDVIKAGVARFLEAYRPDLPLQHERPAQAAAKRLAEAIAPHVHPRVPTFCTGCPERPIFAAMKLIARELGEFHVSCDVGCHLFSVFPPFSTGSTAMGYGLSGAGAAALSAKGTKRAISILGDGGFWHNGLVSSIGNAVFNKTDNVHIIVDNGSTAATGGQDIPSSATNNIKRATRNSIERALTGAGVRWVRTVPRTYDIKKMCDTLKEALTTPESGPKVIVARSECMLTRQRREGPDMTARLKKGERTFHEKFGTDPEICTGDRSCIRLSGCPSLTIAPNPDCLHLEPVTKVSPSCVACGLCGEVAHAAVLCPSFYRASVIHNPSIWDRLRARLFDLIIRHFQRRLERPGAVLAGAGR